MHQKALNQGSFRVNQQLHDKHLTIDELKERLQENDQSIPVNLIQQVQTSQILIHFGKKESLSLIVFFMLKEHNVLPTYFDTSSCTENHWQPLQQLFIKYVAQIRRVNINMV